MASNILALIPARGGSKSIPSKNIRALGGHPLIAYSIWVAKRTPSVSRVIVSTDSEEIASIASRCGAEVPFIRPAELATDDSADRGFFAHAIDWLAKHESYAPQLIVHLRPTTPLRTPALIEKAIRAMIDNPQMDSLRSVHKIPFTPYKLFYIEDKCLKGFFPDHPDKEYHNLPRQIFPDSYVGNGYVDVIRTASFIRSGLLHGNRIFAFEIPERVIDIDSREDLLEAERLLERYKEHIVTVS